MKYSARSIFEFKTIGWANKWKQELDEGYNEKVDLGFQKYVNKNIHAILS